MTDSAVVEGHVKLRDGKKVPRSRRPFGTGGPDRRPPRPAGGGASPLSPPLALPNPCPFRLSLQWKSRWLVLRKPSPVAGKSRAA